MNRRKLTGAEFRMLAEKEAEAPIVAAGRKPGKSDFSAHGSHGGLKTPHAQLSTPVASKGRSGPQSVVAKA